MPHRFNHDRYRVSGAKKVDLDRFSTRCDLKDFSKSDANDALEHDRENLAAAQRMLYADTSRSLLIIFQAMDAAGKDGTIRHVMSGVNPQGCSVTSFKAPTDLEVAHHFLWRPTRALPPKGHIAIFNRSYYEETLVVRVHPQWLAPQKIPAEVLDPSTLSDSGISKGGPPKEFWQGRFDAINGFEKELADHGTTILKFYLNVSKDEQRERFLERIETPDKNWKFNAADIRERGYWSDYRRAYEQVLQATSSESAPWYVIPADQKWFMRALVADIVTDTLGKMNLSYPELPEVERNELAEAADMLRREED